ncbi:MAG: CSLREA domain-containing protein [Chloroflexi bacterium]|nr:CSLREA domain-containing protein [Chloroflexota bacterium]
MTSLPLSVLVPPSWPLAPRPVYGATISVTTTTDEATNNTTCSLREAIISANNNSNSHEDACTAGSGADTISLGAFTYTLTITGQDEDAAATGDLDITSNITIDGAGASSTIIQAGTTSSNGIDRVFHIVSGTVQISAVTIRYGIPGGSFAIGGGIRIGSATLTLSNCVISNNSVAGIQNSGTFTISDSLIVSNSSTSSGGGIANNKTLSVTRSTFSSNSSTSNGGGIFQGQSGTTMTVTNTTFTGNSASNLGGAVANFVGSATFTNSTFSGNSATYGGGIGAGSGTVNLKNVIVANNTATNSGPDCNGTITSQGYNLIESTSGCTFSSTTGDITGQDPSLASLADNGGSTQTHRLLPGSVAIDAGTNTDCPATDQRGVSRPVDGGSSDGTATCDMGAYEAPGFQSYENTCATITDAFSGSTNQVCVKGSGFIDSATYRVRLYDGGGNLVTSFLQNGVASSTLASGLTYDLNRPGFDGEFVY